MTATQIVETYMLIGFVIFLIPFVMPSVLSEEEKAMFDEIKDSFSLLGPAWACAIIILGSIAWPAVLLTGLIGKKK